MKKLVILPFVSGTAQEQSAYERALARRLAALEYKLQYITGGPNEVVISGANLRIVNGLGNTETTNGLGNLIVGYNELRQETPACTFEPIPSERCFAQTRAQARTTWSWGIFTTSSGPGDW